MCNHKYHFHLQTVAGDNYLAKKKDLYFAFIDLEKAVDQVLGMLSDGF